MPKVLFLTGGSGLLSVNWAITLRNQYSIILGLHERILSIDKTTSYKLNLNEVDEIINFLKVNNVLYAVNTAGLTNVETCEINNELAYQINVKLAENMAIACSLVGVKLVHISTDHLFSGDKSNLDETENTNPINVYGKSKAIAEQVVLKRNPDALIIRTNFFGWGTKYRPSFSDMIIKALRAKKNITLYDDVFYCPILIETLVMVVEELVEKKAKGIFNAVGNTRLSKYDFGIKLTELFNLDKSYISRGKYALSNNKVPRPLDMSLSNKKLVSFLGKDISTLDKQMINLCEQENLGISNEIYNL
jgi:dTDP-4-dehydrorhamnose reductase